MAQNPLFTHFDLDEPFLVGEMSKQESKMGSRGDVMLVSKICQVPLVHEIGTKQYKTIILKNIVTYYILIQANSLSTLNFPLYLR